MCLVTLPAYRIVLLILSGKRGPIITMITKYLLCTMMLIQFISLSLLYHALFYVYECSFLVMDLARWFRE